MSDIFNATEDEIIVPFEYPLPFRISFYILYNIVFICGLSGNLLVYYTLNMTSPRLKTLQNVYLSNLSLGDLLIVCVCVPVGYIEVLWQYWPFGTIPCHLLSPAKAVGVFVSAYTLVALALDRYMAIVHPLKPGLSKGQAKFIIISIWIAAFITAIPVAIYVQVRVHEPTQLTRCGEYGWSSEVEELTYNVVLLFLQYIFPALVLIYTYARIIYVVWGRRKTLANPPTSKGKKKTVILSLLVVLCYTLAWLPYNIVYLLNQNGPDWIVESELFPYIFLTCHFLAMSHTTFNPVIYVWINQKFRRALCQVLVSKTPCLAHALRITTNGKVYQNSWNLNSTQTKSFKVLNYEES